MKAYCLVHTILLSPLFDGIISHDSTGLLLLESTDIKDPGQLFPKTLMGVSPVVFKVYDSGKVEFMKDDLDLGALSLNVSVLSEGNLPIVNYASIKAQARTMDNVGSLDLYWKTKVSSYMGATMLNDWLAVRDLEKHIHESNSMTVHSLYNVSTLMHAIKSLRGNVVAVGTRKDNRFPSGYRLSQDDFEGKGELGGRCNVNACQLPGTALFFNAGTNAYYCYHCALGIHRANRSDYSKYGPLFNKHLLADARNTGELTAESITNQHDYIKQEREAIRALSRI